MANGKVVIDTELNTTDFEKGLSTMDSSASKWSTTMKASLVAVGAGITALGASFVSSGIQFNKSVENYQTSFEVMLGSQELAAEKMQELIDIGASTPFEVTQLADATTQLLAFGVASDDTSKYLLQLGDISQGSGEKLDSLILSFGKMQSSQKVTLEYLNIMIEQGFNPLNIIAEQTGETMSELYDRVSEGGVSFEEITNAISIATSEGGQFYQSMEKQSKTLEGVTSTLKDEYNELAGKAMEPLFNFIKTTAIPAASELISTMSKKIDDTDWKEVGKALEDIWELAKFVAIAFVALKTAMMIDSAIKSIQTAQVQLALFSKTATTAQLGTAMWNGTLTATESIVGILTGKISLATAAQGAFSTATSALNKVMVANPVLAVVAGITALVAVIKLVVEAVNKEMTGAIENMADGFTEFNENVASAESKLGDFSNLFSQFDSDSQEITSSIADVQEGITAITSIASAERRALTDSEIQRLDEYFNKLNELQAQELAISQARTDAVFAQAQTQAQIQNTSIEEYQANAETWIATATEQNNTQLALIEEQAITEIGLLNQKYGDKATLDNEEYAREYNAIVSSKEEQITATNEKLGSLYAEYSKGYADRLGLENIFNEDYDKAVKDRENIEKLYNAEKQRIMDDEELGTFERNEALKKLEDTYGKDLETAKLNEKKTWQDSIKDMDEAEQEQLGAWIAMVANADMYGGELDADTQTYVNGMISNFDELPAGTKQSMTNAMQGMIDGMDSKQSATYSKASSIANGILASLNKALDIHSPSRETRKIAQFVMQGMEQGLEDEENNLQRQVDSLATNMLDSFGEMQKAVSIETSKMNTNVQTGGVFNNIANTVPVNVNNTNTTVLEVDRRVLAEVTNEANEDINLQYSF